MKTHGTYAPSQTLDDVINFTHTSTPASAAYTPLFKRCQIQIDSLCDLVVSCLASLLTRGPVDTEQNQALSSGRAALSSLQQGNELLSDEKASAVPFFALFPKEGIV